MILDRERSFNPLAVDRVRQFDAAHHGVDGPVKNDNGAYLIFEDGSARDLNGDRLDPADKLEPAERRRWQIYWAKKKIIQLSAKFPHQRALALQTLSDDDKRQLQELHDRIVQIRTNLDALERTPESGVPARQPTHGVRGHNQFFGNGAKHLQELERTGYWCREQLTEAKRALHALTQGVPPDELPNNQEIANAQSSVESWERHITANQKAIADHEEWMAMPFLKRQEINERLFAAYREECRAESQEVLKRKADIAGINLSFIEDDESLQTPLQKRLAEDQQREDVIRQESSEWLNSRMNAKEQRERNVDVEQSAKAEMAEALQEGDADRTARDKKTIKRPQAKKAKRR